MHSFRFLGLKPLLRTRTLTIRGIGIREMMPPSYVERPGGTGDYLFMLFHDAVEWGEQRRRLPAGTIVLWPCGASHFYGNGDRRWLHSWIHCDGPAISRILKSAGLTLPRRIALRDPAVVDRGLSALQEEVAGQLRADPVVTRNLTENLIRDIARAGRRSPAPTIPHHLAAVRAYLDDCYEQPTTLGRLADRAGLSRNHFCTEFRRAFGMTPIAYLTHRRLHAAAALLRGTQTPVAQIGRQVGYPDPYYFSKHFKACFGVPPTHLRTHQPKR